MISYTGRLSFILLAVTLIMTSCAINQSKNSEGGGSSIFQPQFLNDDWTKFLVGEWEGSGQSSGGKGKGLTKIELALNGQFLIITGRATITEVTPEQRKYNKETLHVSDEDITKFIGSTFKSIEFRTTDPETGEIIAYLFDSMRCIARGTGRLEGNKEIMDWQWSLQGQGAVSTRITEKLGNDRIVITEKYSLPDGGTMEDYWEMVRRK
jgi:hypothetical protein